MKTRTYFAHRIDMLDAAGELQEHLAGVEDYILAEAVCARGNRAMAGGDPYAGRPGGYEREGKVWVFSLW